MPNQDQNQTKIEPLFDENSSKRPKIAIKMAKSKLEKSYERLRNLFHEFTFEMQPNFLLNFLLNSLLFFCELSTSFLFFAAEENASCQIRNLQNLTLCNKLQSANIQEFSIKFFSIAATVARKTWIKADKFLPIFCPFFGFLCIFV